MIKGTRMINSLLRTAWVEIDCSRLRHNIKEVKKRVGDGISS